MTGTTIPHVTVSITEAIDITDVTSGTIGGTGVLDKLLTTMTEHLTAQYEKRRITGVEYATLYLGAYQSTLQQALALTAAKEIQAYEIKNLEWEAKLKEAQYNLAVKQLEIATYELTNKVPVEVANLEKEGLSVAKQTELYEQKRLTEVAQLDGSDIVAGSVLASQRDLLEAQTLGLERDAKQKVAKQMLDAWVARSTINDVADPTFVNKIRDQEVGAAVTALFDSISLSMPPETP